ncbi:MAG TPA: HesA/MoeB/ThiF family protein [Ignavibacteria bacterium]|nr:HesA/MoeB/ThiF family protein [Ignavibacteria bacterium]HMR40785.1 HesA/MoeB/ThiF family protein [Ignavibacteria bacterium]
MLDHNEIEKYSRQIILEDIGEEGQLKLKNAGVIVIGAGGLGSPVLEYLTAAGVGNICILDFDLVERSNLHRQVIYNEDDIDRPKAEVAAEKLRKKNSNINIIAINERLGSHNVNSLLGNYDVIVDCTDNFESRYLIDKFCDYTGKPMVYGSVHRYQGQVSVFNYELYHRPDHPPTYRCLYPKPPEEGSGLDCSEGGVFGVLPGIIGTMQAAEVIKIITGIGGVLSGRLLCFNMKTMESTIIEIKRNIKHNGSSSPDEELRKFYFSDHDENSDPPYSEGEDISAEELLKWINEKKDIQIIDVREDKINWLNIDEYIGLDCIKIAKSEIENDPQRVSRDKDVVLFCDYGKISQGVMKTLKKNFGITNLYNLSGGFNGWKRLKKKLDK